MHGDTFILHGGSHDLSLQILTAGELLAESMAEGERERDRLVWRQGLGTHARLQVAKKHGEESKRLRIPHHESLIINTFCYDQ
jgi:hypothetical protein